MAKLKCSCCYTFLVCLLRYHACTISNECLYRGERERETETERERKRGREKEWRSYLFTQYIVTQARLIDSGKWIPCQDITLTKPLECGTLYPGLTWRWHKYSLAHIKSPPKTVFYRRPVTKKEHTRGQLIRSCVIKSAGWETCEQHVWKSELTTKFYDLDTDPI